MKKIIFVLVFVFIPVFAYSSDRVTGHWRDTNHDGLKDTYVQPHQRTAPNSTARDNYSYPGNYNPNTGRITPGDPYRQQQNNPYGNKRNW